MSLAYDTYDAIEAVRWSALSHLRESPAHYQAALAHPRESTPALELGIAAHMAILEPDRFASEVAVWEGGTRRGKLWDAWKEANAGKLHLRTQDVDPLLCMREAVRAHPAAAPLLDSGEAEVSLTWDCPETGLACKARADWLHVESDAALLVDLKTARTTCPRRFARAVADYGYHGQLAHYAEGVAAVHGVPVEAVRVVIVAVEKAPPYDVVVYELDHGIPDGALHVGRELRTDLMRQLAQCIEADHWPGRSEGVESLCLPGWALGDVADELTFGDEE